MSKKYDKMLTVSIWYNLPGGGFVDFTFTHFNKGTSHIIKQAVRKPTTKHVNLARDIMLSGKFPSSGYAGDSHLSFYIHSPIPNTVDKMGNKL